MAEERVFCPIKADTIGNSKYLRWVQFCERTCPFCKDSAVCDHPSTELRFPQNTKKVLVEKVPEVEEAWRLWMGSFTSGKLPQDRTF